MLKRSITDELIKKFEELLEQIIYNKKNKNYTKALDLIDDAFKYIFRLSIKFFNSFSTENLLEIIKSDGTINADKYIMMGKLLKEEGDILENQHKEQYAFYIYEKSLNLFLNAFLIKNDHCDLENYFSDIDPIIIKVSPYKLSRDIENRLIEYYLKVGSFDKAEDILYEILKDSDFSKECLKNAVEFYETLLLKSENELNRGNLPREEIIESRNSLNEKLLKNK
ncbi:DUF6483 family protein [Clostridium kluyveri]|uniref:Tetratricopeptide repeat protein n=1 Tax=Clostridium kluyveri TaxID=1534 RepID=A0A1L5FBL9_CLOKL|nr:DUF6483 family protein [Clostridium kluyveri]APM40363.1 hypothetical protein BS101_17295 [Clostridium kluyveri]